MNKKVLIVGLGLIGGSYAQGLTLKGYEVGAIDTNSQSIKYGLDNNLIKWGQTEVSEDYIKMFDIVIFALYPHVLINWLKQYQKFFKKGTIITDVTGVKGWVVKEINKFLRDDIEYVGTHPMAGREVYGVENSDYKIFKGANYIIIPCDAKDYAIEEIRKIGQDLEFKNIVMLSPEYHDEMIGFLSQLTHVIAVSLMTCKESKHLVEYTGDSFRDLTRIAKINENMWSELFLLNKEELVRQIELFQNQLEKMRKSIEDEDLDTMKEMMIVSTSRRKYFDK